MITTEILLKATPSKVWTALSDKNEMKKWYFDLDDFKPESGFKFQFYGGEEGCKQYLHLCEVVEVVNEKKLAYSWEYAGYKGISFVEFELSEQENGTLLQLNHINLDSLDQTNPDFAEANFVAGWEHIIKTALPEYLKNK
jgi:uncharacterized protein YndB with AHSA1/START domain